MLRTTFVCCAILLGLEASPTVAVGNELTPLVKEYRAASAKIGGTPKDRARKAKESLGPLIEKIRAVGSDAALAFLMKEVDEALPEVGALCAGAVVKSGHARSLAAALRGFAKRHRVIREEILTALAEPTVSLDGAEPEILRIARAERESEVKLLLPPVLARFGTISAAKAMMQGVGANVGSRKKGESGDPCSDAVVAALGKTTSEDVKTWLSTGAFKAAGKDVKRLTVAARLAGLLKLEDARRELEKLTSHRSMPVAIASLEALTQIGVASSMARITAALEARKGKNDLEYRIRALDAIASSGTAAAVKLIGKLARGRDANMRAVAMGSLGLMLKQPAAVGLLIAGLKDDEAGVRAGALRAMTGARDKRVIGPLIEFMDTDKEHRLKVDALTLLVKLTGNNMGLVAADWRNWWELAGPRFEFPKKGEKAVTSVKAYDLSYFGIEISSRRLSFVVDMSGSMRQTVSVRSKKGNKSVPKIEVLKGELESTIRKLPGDSQINIITFDATYRAWQKKLQPLARSGREKAIKFVRKINTGGGTNVFDTLEHALQDKRVNTIYLLTDGNPTRGRLTDPDAIVREVRVLNRLRSVTIHCIAFGEDSDLLQRLAAQNGGKYRFINKT